MKICVVTKEEKATCLFPSRSALETLKGTLAKSGIALTKDLSEPCDAALFFSLSSKKELLAKKRAGSKILVFAPSFPKKAYVPCYEKEIRAKSANGIRFFYRKADVLLAPNPFLAFLLKRAYPSKKILVFPFFFDPSDFRKTEPPEDLNGYRPNEKYVLSCGGKGLFSSPSFYFSLARSFPANRFVYLLNGENSSSSKKERKAWNSLPGNVEILEEDSLKNPFSLFKNATVFVSPNPFRPSFKELYAAFGSNVPSVMRSQPGFIEGNRKLPFSFSDTVRAEFVSDIRAVLTGNGDSSLPYEKEIFSKHAVSDLSKELASVLRQALETEKR